MRIKKFELFDFTTTIPTTSTDFLSNHYICNDCGNNFKSFNKRVKYCTKCQSNNISLVDKDEWESKNPKDSDSDVFHDLIDLAEPDLINAYDSFKYLKPYTKFNS